MIQSSSESIHSSVILVMYLLNTLYCDVRSISTLAIWCLCVYTYSLKLTCNVEDSKQDVVSKYIIINI